MLQTDADLKNGDSIRYGCHVPRLGVIGVGVGIGSNQRDQYHLVPGNILHQIAKDAECGDHLRLASGREAMAGSIWPFAKPTKPMVKSARIDR